MDSLGSPKRSWCRTKKLTPFFGPSTMAWYQRDDQRRHLESDLFKLLSQLTDMTHLRVTTCGAFTSITWSSYPMPLECAIDACFTNNSFWHSRNPVRRFRSHWGWPCLWLTSLTFWWTVYSVKYHRSSTSCVTISSNSGRRPGDATVNTKC